MAVETLRESRENRRLGRIVIPDAVRDMPPQYGTIFEGMVPLDIDHDWQRRRLIYVCWCKQFDVIPQDGPIPFYRGVYTVDSVWKFERQPTP
jgi:hypothetical protein